MERPNYHKLYKPPKGYVPPQLDKLREDSQNPNYNSLQYRLKPINRTPRILKYFDCFSINDSGLIILGCNELTGRLWDAYVWGFENVQSFGSESAAPFKIHLDSNITNLRFLDERVFVTTQANGSLQVWSTKSENKQQKTYCLFLMSQKAEHSAVILSMATLNKNKTIVTGCSHGLLKVWDFEKENTPHLFSIHSLHDAHTDSITGISSRSDSEFIFATCSLDRSALIWDYRQPRPATGLYQNHEFDFTTIHWCDLNETDSEMIYLGDAAGDIHIIDPKMPNKIVEKVQIHTRPITKLRFCGTKLAVLGETNLIKVYDIKKNNAKGEPTHGCIYKDSTATNFVRDALWNPLNENELLTIGWDTKLNRHIIS